jgi:hypothetical protein
MTILYVLEMIEDPATQRSPVDEAELVLIKF